MVFLIDRTRIYDASRHCNRRNSEQNLHIWPNLMYFFRSWSFWTLVLGCLGFGFKVIATQACFVISYDLFKQILTNIQWTNKNKSIIMPLPYLSDLAPADFFLFPKLKRPMKGKRFTTLDRNMSCWWYLKLHFRSVTIFTQRFALISLIYCTINLPVRTSVWCMMVHVIDSWER